MNEAYARLARAARVHRQAAADHEKAVSEDSRQRLARILATKLTTSFIGALACFEHAFGRLWGNKKRRENCSPEELPWFDLWQLTRTEVLNNGNNQLRAVQNELSFYEMTWLRHQHELRVGPEPIPDPGETHERH
jgi:hypothetical protein